MQAIVKGPKRYELCSNFGTHLERMLFPAQIQEVELWMIFKFQVCFKELNHFSSHWERVNESLRSCIGSAVALDAEQLFTQERIKFCPRNDI